MEVVEDANNELLESTERYFLYLKQEAERIISDLQLSYADIQDERKIYPKFTKKQFSFILQALQQRVYAANRTLIYGDIYINRLDVAKVEKAYNAFKMLCLFYSITPNLDLFSIFSGVEYSTLVEWLNTGRSKLFATIQADCTAIDNIDMLNSTNSLLRAYYRNNRQEERIEEGSSNILPDLLALPKAPNLSITDGQKGIDQD